MNHYTKVAFLLSVYGNPVQANYFIKQALSYEGSYVFIHIDKKNKSLELEIYQDSRVIILPKNIDVSWGAYSQIQAYNYMFRYVREYGEFDYYSLNSGNDLFIRPINEFIDFIQQTNQYAYYNCEPLPKSYWQYRGGFGRIELYWPKIFLKRYSDRHILRYLRTIYGTLYHYHLLPSRKLPADIQFFGGNDWFTISNECVKEMIEYIDSTDYDNVFEHSYIGTEIYYVTLFEKLKKSRSVINNNNLRFVDWKPRGQKRNSGSPNILTMECLPDIIESKRFFGRKFDYRFDNEVVQYFVNL